MEFSGTRKIERQTDGKMVCTSPVGTLVQGPVLRKGDEQKREVDDSGNNDKQGWQMCIIGADPAAELWK